MHDLLLKMRPKQKTIKLYLYANNQCIKRIKVLEGENIFENNYIINVIGKKHIFGTNYVKIIVRPVKMLKNIKGEIHATIDYERGIEL